MVSIIRLFGRITSFLDGCLVRYKSHKINMLLGGG